MSQKSDFKLYFSIILGAFILAFGLFNIHSRCDISEGGVLGLSLLLYNWFDITPAISSPIMDCLAMMLGTIILKKDFLKNSIIASISYALWYGLFELIGPVLPSFSDKLLLAAVVGGILVGLGTSLIVLQGGAAGADDSLALVVHEKTHLPLAKFYVLNDLVVLTLSLSYIPFDKIAYSLLSVCISSSIISLICTKDHYN